MCSRGFPLTGTLFFTEHFRQGPAVVVARLRYPRQEGAAVLPVQPEAGEADQVCPEGQRALYRRR